MFVFGKRLIDKLGWLVAAVPPVLLVLGVLELYMFSDFPCSTRKTAEKDMSVLQQQVELYRVQHGQLPDSLVQLVDAGMLREYPVDPWGTDYQAFARPDGSAFVVRCAGPDGVQGTRDDVFAE